LGFAFVNAEQSGSASELVSDSGKDGRYISAKHTAVWLRFCLALAFFCALVSGHNNLLTQNNIFTFSYKGLPLTAVSPIRRRHFALGNILSVTVFKRLPLFLLCHAFALLRSASGFCALLTKADGLNLVTLFCHNDMALGRVAGSALALVVLRHPCSG
jgi:hypothetical protein